MYNREVSIKPVFKESGMAIVTAPDAPAFGLTIVSPSWRFAGSIEFIPPPNTAGLSAAAFNGFLEASDGASVLSYQDSQARMATLRLTSVNSRSFAVRPPLTQEPRCIL